MDPEEDHGPRMLATTWSLVGLSGAFLTVRVICKLKTKRRLWWDDYVLILSWIMLLASIVGITLSVSKGLGKHVQFVPPENFPTLGVVGNLTGTLSILAATWSKTSFAITLLRLMQGKLRWLLWFIILTVNVMMGLNALFMWIRCTPVERTWNPFAPGTCWPDHIYTAFAMTAAGYSAGAEFALALLPWKVIWKLQMKRKEKIGVAIAMSMGMFAGGTAVVKTLEIPALANPDFTFVSVGLVQWGAAESGVTIMAASIPVLRTLFRDLNAISRRYYMGGSRPEGTQNSKAIGSHSTGRYATENTITVSAGDQAALEPTKDTNLSENLLQDPYGRIMQSKEVMIDVEYRKYDEECQCNCQCKRHGGRPGHV